MLKLLRKNEGLGGQWCWGTALVGKFRAWSGLQYGDPKTFNMLRKMKENISALVEHGRNVFLEIILLLLLICQLTIIHDVTIIVASDDYCLSFHYSKAKEHKRLSS